MSDSKRDLGTTADVVDALVDGSPLERLFQLLPPDRQREVISELITRDLSRQTYLTPEEAAEYLRFRTTQSFRAWAHRYGFVPCRTGRRLLFLRSDFDGRLQEVRRAVLRHRRLRQNS